MIVIGVFEYPDEEIVDLVAFKPSAPTKWWLRLGQAVVLGRDNARLALIEEKSVVVHPTPLSWLQVDCQGCVVLDWKRDILSCLDGYGVLAADVATRKRLERAFRRDCHIPAVRVVT